MSDATGIRLGSELLANLDEVSNAGLTPVAPVFSAHENPRIFRARLLIAVRASAPAGQSPAPPATEISHRHAGYCRMLTARETTSPIVTSETSD